MTACQALEPRRHSSRDAEGIAAGSGEFQMECCVSCDPRIIRDIVAAFHIAWRRAPLAHRLQARRTLR